MRKLTILAASVWVALAVSAAPALADPQPFGHGCTAQNGVRFCPTTALAQRVPSWDGTPMDVDVTLPATGTGPFPTIVLLHGLGGDKTMFEDTSAAGSQALAYHYNNVYYAQKGYAVVTPTARGFGNSCGSQSKSSTGCAQGWTHLDDNRYEARDVQQLLGLLVDQGIASPSALGVTGVSYGGGTSAQLAFLKDRVRLPDGSFAAWRSPAGTALHIAAAYPRWGWANLATALVPNGRANDGAPSNYAQETAPVGNMKLSYTTVLYAISGLVGQLAPSGADPSADLTGWYTRLLAGEPYTGSTISSMIGALSYKGTTGITGVPSPMLIENGWADDLFSAQQGLALYNQARTASASADVSLQIADTGHFPASNRTDAIAKLVDAGSAFFDAKLRASGSAPAAGSVKLYPMTCPAGTATAAPFTAATWVASHPGTLSFNTTWLQSTTSSGLNYFGQLDDDPVIPALGNTLGDIVTGLISGTTDISTLTGVLGGDGSAVGPLFTQALQNSNPCRVASASLSTNSIVSLGAKATRAFTLAGMPRVTVDLTQVGPDGQLAARLWDVRPNGSRILVTRGSYRLTAGQSGRVSFQLDGNAYTFPVGDQPMVELLSTDSPYLRPSNGLGTTWATKVAVALPTVQAAP